MTIIASGISNGAVSILHAMGNGKGCSIPIKLQTRVNLHDVSVVSPACSGHLVGLPVALCTPTASLPSVSTVMHTF